MKNILRSLLLMSLAVFTINSCKKAEVDTETQSSTDNATAESEFTTIMPTVNSVAIKDKGVQKMQGSYGSCPQIWFEDADTSDGFPVTLKFIYDTINGCTDSSGVFKKGVITAVFNKPWHPDSIGTNLVVVTVNLESNYKKFTGTMYISKPTVNSYNTVLSGGKCTWTSGKYVTLDYNKTLTQTAGSNTPHLFIDDVFQFTGTSNGVNRDGRAYTVNITSPLVKAAVCKYIQKGTLELTPSGLATRTVDYGDGTCDSKATITINGNTFNFNID